MLVRERVSAEESALTDHPPPGLLPPRSTLVGRPPVVSLAPFLALRVPAHLLSLSLASSLFLSLLSAAISVARSCSFSHANPPASPFRRAVLSKQRERLCPLVPAVKPGRILNSRHFIAFAIYRRAARPKDVSSISRPFYRVLLRISLVPGSSAGLKRSRGISARCHAADRGRPRIIPRRITLPVRATRRHAGDETHRVPCARLVVPGRIAESSRYARYR